VELMFSKSGKTHVLRTGEALCGAVGEMSRGRCVRMREGNLITCRTCLKLWTKTHHPVVIPFSKTELLGPIPCHDCKKTGMYVGVKLAGVEVYCEKCGYKATYKLEQEDTGQPAVAHSALRAFGKAGEL
jgi:hypothetical protein